MNDETQQAGEPAAPKVVLEKVMINIEPDVLAQVEDYRRYRPGEIVSRNVAIVELVRHGLDAKAASVDKKPKK